MFTVGRSSTLCVNRSVGKISSYSVVSSSILVP